MNWSPVVPGSVDVTVKGTDRYVDDGAGKLIKVPAGGSVVRKTVMVENKDGVLEGTPGRVVCEVFQSGGEAVTDSAGVVIYGKQDFVTGKTATGIYFTEALTDQDAFKLTYVYNNIVVPQNDLPILNAEMKALPLVAKARRIAIYYSQIAAFQAKTDYGFDLGEQLAEKAVGQLSYEIDVEVTNLLIDNAATSAELTFNKAVPPAISKAEHYEGFNEMVELAKAEVYSRTKRFVPNYMLITPSILPILSFIRGWNAASTSNINGPYLAGSLNGLKVFVTPNMTVEDGAVGAFVLGVNGDDLMSSAAVYAPLKSLCA